MVARLIFPFAPVSVTVWLSPSISLMDNPLMIRGVSSVPTRTVEAPAMVGAASKPLKSINERLAVSITPSLLSNVQLPPK